MLTTMMSEKLVSIRELSLFAFALLLIAAAAPAKNAIQSAPEQQPVNVTIPADQNTDVILKTA